MKCLRVIVGITKWDHRTNESIREETEQCTVAELVTRNRLRWLGHMARMPEGRLPSTTTVRRGRRERNSRQAERKMERYD